MGRRLGEGLRRGLFRGRLGGGEGVSQVAELREGVLAKGAGLRVEINLAALCFTHGEARCGVLWSVARRPVVELILHEVYRSGNCSARA